MSTQKYVSQYHYLNSFLLFETVVNTYMNISSTKIQRGDSLESGLFFLSLFFFENV